MGERKVIILENGVRVADNALPVRLLAGTFLRSITAFAPEERAGKKLVTLLDMETDYKKGKIKGFKVSENDPILKPQTLKDINPQLVAYRESRRNGR